MQEAKISSEIIDIYPEDIKDFEISIKYKNVDRLIGKEIPHDQIKQILTDLDISITNESEQGIQCKVPPYRFDVTREADVIEEILRIYGYNNIELEESYGADFLANFPTPDKDKIQEKTGLFLSANGFHEIISNSLTNPDYVAKTGFWNKDQNVTILNKLSEELGVMRQTLVFSGIGILALQHQQKTNESQVLRVRSSLH